MLFQILSFTEGQFPSGLGWHDKIVEGFPQSSLWSIARTLGVEASDVAGLVGYPMEQVAWRSRSEKLSVPASDKLFQIARAYQRLMVPLQDEDAVRAWLRNHQPSLDGRIPVLELMTQPGAAAVFKAIEEIKPVKTVAMNSEYETEDKGVDDLVRKVGDDDSAPNLGLDAYPEA